MLYHNFNKEPLQFRSGEKDLIICLSGGLDSGCAAALMKSRIKKAVFFKYPSKHNERERMSARKLAEHLGIDLAEIDVTNVFESMKSALLKGEQTPLPVGWYSDKEVSSAKVPFRNGIFASILTALAEDWGCSGIVLGVHSGDHLLYPDCTPNFFNAFADAVAAYSEDKIDIYTPFIEMSKAEIVEQTKRYAPNMPYEITYSCYNGGDRHCGVCPTCLERREALSLVKDNTIYETNIEDLLPEEFNTESCKAVLHDRAKIYGRSMFTSHKDEIVGYYCGIQVSPEMNQTNFTLGGFFKSFFAMKAHRAAKNPENADHFIDFVNYACLAADAGIQLTFSEERYKSAKAINRFFRIGKDFTESDLVILVESIRQNGGL